MTNQTMTPTGPAAFHHRMARFPDDVPRLAVVVDTEEEFDWRAPFSRANTATTSAVEQDRAHEIYDAAGVVPTYVVSHPIATDPCAAGYFRNLAAAGRCDVGAHLHPWVTPPHEERLSVRNSYHGNLPAELERRKIRALTAAIEAGLGRRPTAFKAGRYGVGPHSFASLKVEGYTVDCSVVPYTQLGTDGGPSYHGWPAAPFWIDQERMMLEVPLTTGFSGVLATLGPRLPGLWDSALARRCRLPGLLARGRLVERATLTPEGVTAPEMIRLLRALLRQGVRVFSLTYHSPSLGLGFTPYVRDEHDRRAFLAAIRAVVRVFRDEAGGRFVTLRQLYDEARSLN